MKRKDLASLAMLGISAGLLVCGCEKNRDRHPPNTAAAEQTYPDMDSLYNSLSPDAKRKFDQLDDAHKAVVLKQAQEGCNGADGCSADPNKAVNIQYDDQMRKGGNNQPGMNNPNQPKR